MNARLVSCPSPVITFGWVWFSTHPKVMTGNGQLTRGDRGGDRGGFRGGRGGGGLRVSNYSEET